MQWNRILFLIPSLGHRFPNAKQPFILLKYCQLSLLQECETRGFICCGVIDNRLRVAYLLCRQMCGKSAPHFANWLPIKLFVELTYKNWCITARIDRLPVDNHAGFLCVSFWKSVWQTAGGLYACNNNNRLSVFSSVSVGKVRLCHIHYALYQKW